MDYLAVLYTVTFACLISFIHHAWKLGRRQPNMPPGPPTKPIIGNLLDIVSVHRLHKTFHKLAKQYGDVFSVKVLGRTMIIISSPTISKEVIDIHANASGNRPSSAVVQMIVPEGLNVGLCHADDLWKAMRRALNQFLNNDNMRKMIPYQRAEAAQLMWELANHPDPWFYHIKRFVISLVLAVMFGIRGPTLQNPNVKEFLEVQPQFVQCTSLSNRSVLLLDLFPILARIPERFAEWSKHPKEVGRLQEQMYDRILTTVEKRVASGHGIGNFMEELITTGPSVGIPTRHHLMHLGGAIMEGSDTSSGALQVVVLALTRYPEIQRKAQEEMDRIVGLDRTPNEHDIKDLKYMHAVIEECLRLRAITPLSPREMAEDAVIDGLFYPKGAALFVNIYAMFHDERYFDRPDEFIPERFLKHPFGIKDGVEDDPARRPNMAFGGGKRVCPGIAFSKSSLELNTANFIWGFDFLPAIDPDTGKEVYPDLDDYDEGLNTSPKPFPLRIRPRSAHHKELIDRQFQSVSDILSQYEYDLSPVDQEFNAKYRDI